jgi:hypothetical protein
MLIKVPLYESTWGREDTTPPFFTCTLDGSDQVHAPTALLPLRKSP